jgi:lipopolysaccharide transport system ATP-binding protein
VVEAARERLRHPLQRVQYEEFKALDDVTVEIPWGEAVGIVGRNGAGKSTLLKILTRITAPTRGRVELGGRMGSLLEVGTGFHPELTGRENVFLSGSLLGMRRKEIQKQFESIVEFSGVEKFLDTQVKRYSSGMYVRLAFAVAAHLETEILAIDEVLAVGDAEFQAKSLAKMRDVAKDGRTVLYVSHQMQTVTSLCTSAMYLERGTVRYYGGVEGALQHYRDSFTTFAAANQDAWEAAATFAVLPVSPYPELAGDEAMDTGLVLADFTYDAGSGGAR